MDRDEEFLEKIADLEKIAAWASGSRFTAVHGLLRWAISSLRDHHEQLESTREESWEPAGSVDGEGD